MKHRGEIVLKRLKESGISKTALAEKLDVNRNTIYNYLDNANLHWDIIIQIGKAINHDFSEDFNDISPVFNESAAEYKKTTLVDCLKEKRELQEKFWNLSDKYTQLLETHNNLLSGKLGLSQ